MKILAEYACLNFVKNFRLMLNASESDEIVSFYCDAKRSVNTLKEILEDSVLYGAAPRKDNEINAYVSRALRHIKNNM